MFYYKQRTVNPTLALTKLSLSTENHAGRHYFKNLTNIIMIARYKLLEGFLLNIFHQMYYCALEAEEVPIQAFKSHLF